MILVDTSVWVDYLRAADDALAAMLEHTIVLMHPMIIGELACGNLQNRGQLLSLWRNLPSIVTATDDEAIYFLEQHRLMGRALALLMCICSLLLRCMATRFCGRGTSDWQG